MGRLKRFFRSLSGSKGVRRVFLLLAFLLLGIVLVLAVGRVVLFVLGTIMQFWYGYTQTTWLLWALTVLSFGLILSFGYLLWVKRAEYLKKEESGDDLNDVYGGFEEDW